MELQTDDESGEVIDVRTPAVDTHVHGRWRPKMDVLLPEAAKRMSCGMLEPNTLVKNAEGRIIFPHLETYKDVLRYVAEANKITPSCRWVASVYLTANTSIEDVQKAWDERLISHVKRYPPHGTTNSAEAVTPEMLLDRDSKVGRLLMAMSEAGIPLKTHGEVTHWDGEWILPEHRELIYYREFQPRFRDLYPRLRQIGAHIAGQVAVEHFEEFADPDNYVCEVTAHHPNFNASIRYDGPAVRSDHHCLPVINTEENRQALRRFLGHLRRDTERSKRIGSSIFAGSDMAAHDKNDKYAPRVAGGIYTYHCSLELYIQLLDELKLLSFADVLLYANAKRFHKDLVLDNPPSFHLVREPWKVDSHARVQYEDGEMTPFGFDEISSKRYEFQWKLVG